MKPSHVARAVVLGVHAALIGGLAMVAGYSLGIVLVLPLLLPLPGLWRSDRYTFAWASMLLTFYCGGLLAEAYMRPHQSLALRALASVAALEFVSLVLFVRLRSAEARAEAAAARSAGRTAA